MQNFDGNYAQCERIASINEPSFCKLSYLIILSQLPTSFGDVCFDNKVAVAHEHIVFQKKCCGLSARWIMMVLRVPNVHRQSYRCFWQFNFVWECRTWEIFKGFYLGQELFGSLWPLHNLMYHWMFARILPTAPMKMVDKSRINETYSLMKFSILSVSLRSPNASKATCRRVRGGM